MASLQLGPEEVLSQATMADLKKLAGAVGVSCSAAKRVLCAGLAKLMGEAAVRAWAREQGENWLLPDRVSIGADLRHELAWERDFAFVLTHTLDMTAYKIGDNIRSEDSIWSQIAKGWNIDRHDDCPVCAGSPSFISSTTPDLLPPFHAGCRCCPITTLR